MAREFISAASALRDVRCYIELLGKLSGKISSANINFFNIDITQERALEFLLAAEQRGPHLIEYMRGQFGRRFGLPAPNLTVEFVDPPALTNPQHIAPTYSVTVTPMPGPADF